MSDRFLISADHDFYQEEVAEVMQGVKQWELGEITVAFLNAGIHLSRIRDDGTVERLCHHEETVEVTDAR